MNTLRSLFSNSTQPSNQDENTNTDNNNGFPVPNHTLSYWRSELHPIDSYCSSEDLPPSCDIAIIGAGMTGVSTAYHLSRLHSANPSGKKPSIVILDAREVCSGATGRNGGHSKVQAFTMKKLLKEHGLEAANSLAAFVKAQQYHMKDAVERENIDCESEIRRTYDVYIDEEDAKEAEELYRTAITEGHQWARDLDFVGRELVEQVTSIQGAKAAISMLACSLWPYKFVTQLLSKLVDSGTVTLYTHTPIHSITSTSHPSTTTLHTPHGDLTTKKLIFATNAYTSTICPSYKESTIPYKGIACHIAPLHPISPHLSYTYNIYNPHSANDATRVDYLNPRPDSGIVVGGGKHLYASDLPLWYNNTDDSTLLPVRPYFTNYMQRTFKGWQPSKAKITHLWTGIQGETKDGFPYVGKVPGKENWWIAAGFNGGGMTFIFSSSMGMAEMIEGKSFGETGLPRMLDAARMEG